MLAELWLMYYVAVRGGVIMRSSGGARRRYNAIKRRYTAASLWCSHGAITVSVYIIKCPDEHMRSAGATRSVGAQVGFQAPGAHRRRPAERAAVSGRINIVQNPAACGKIDP